MIIKLPSISFVVRSHLIHQGGLQEIRVSIKDPLTDFVSNLVEEGFVSMESS